VKSVITIFLFTAESFPGSGLIDSGILFIPDGSRQSCPRLVGGALSNGAGITGAVFSNIKKDEGTTNLTNQTNPKK